MRLIWKQKYIGMSAERFERKLQERLASVTMEPRPELWQGVAARLGTERKRRKGIIWFWTGGALAAAAAITGLLWMSQPGKELLVPSPTVSPITMDGPESLPDQPVMPVEKLEIFPGKRVGSSSVPAPSPIRKQAPLQANASPKIGTTPTTLAPYQALAPVLPLTGKQLDGPDPRSLSWASLAERNHEGLQQILAGMQATQERGTTNSQIWWETGLPETQETDADKSPRWAFAAQVGQDFAQEPTPLRVGFRDLEVSPSSYYNTEVVLNETQLNQADFVQFSQEVGTASLESVSGATLVDYPSLESRFRLTGSYTLWRRLQLISGLGLSLSNKGTVNQGSINVEDGADFGYPLTDVSVWNYAGELDYRNLQLEIPLELGWRFPRHKPNWMLFGGLSLNHNLNLLGSEKIQVADFETQDMSNSRTLYSSQNWNGLVIPSNDTGDGSVLAYRQWNSYGSLGLRYQYAVGSAMHLYAGPTVKYQLSDIFTGSLSRQQSAWRIGLVLGLNFGRTN